MKEGRPGWKTVKGLSKEHHASSHTGQREGLGGGGQREKWARSIKNKNKVKKREIHLQVDPRSSNLPCARVNCISCWFVKQVCVSFFTCVRVNYTFFWTRVARVLCVFEDADHAHACFLAGGHPAATDHRWPQSRLRLLWALQSRLWLGAQGRAGAGAADRRGEAPRSGRVLGSRLETHPAVCRPMSACPILARVRFVVHSVLIFLGRTASKMIFGVSPPPHLVFYNFNFLKTDMPVLYL